MEFDRFIRPMNYPMYVLTVSGSRGAEPSGCLIGFATQCSITPRRFLACLSKSNHTFRVAAGAHTVALHLLGPRQHDLATLFGSQTGDEVDKFAHCDWEPGPGGVPLLRHCAGWLVGRIDDRVDLGDHEGLVLDPTHVSDRIGARVLMFTQVRDIKPGHPSAG